MSKIYILQLIIDVSLVQMGRHGLEKQPSVQILSLPFIIYVILDKLLSFSKPLIPHYKMGIVIFI